MTALVYAPFTVAYPALRRINEDGRWEPCRNSTDHERAHDLATTLRHALAGQTSERVRVVDPSEGSRPAHLPIVLCNEMHWSSGGVGFFYYLCGNEGQGT